MYVLSIALCRIRGVVSLDIVVIDSGAASRMATEIIAIAVLCELVSGQNPSGQSPSGVGQNPTSLFSELQKNKKKL